MVDKNISHIYWFAHYNMLGPCTRYRGRYVLDALKREHNITFSFVYPDVGLVGLLDFWKTYLTVLCFRKKDSIIVFQKTYTNRIYANLLKVLLFFRPKNTFYDLDDAYYVQYPPQTIQFFLKYCMCCIVGSQSLWDYTCRFNQRVYKIPSPILDHGIIKYKKHETFAIGWVGFYNYHRGSLHELLFPAIQRLKIDVELHLLGVVSEDQKKEVVDYFARFKNVRLNIPLNINWLDEDSFYKRVSTFDVGVSPLLNTEMNRAKSAFKLKQCLSCGVPVIGSPTGENRVVIQDGVNGYLANNSDEFYNRIVKIYSMPNNEYYKMGDEAYKSVKKYYMNNYAVSLLNVFRREMK